MAGGLGVLGDSLGYTLVTGWKGRMWPASSVSESNLEKEANEPVHLRVLWNQKVPCRRKEML